MYPNGVTIVLNIYTSFTPSGGGNKAFVDYGNPSFFFEYSNTTKKSAYCGLTGNENCFTTLYITEAFLDNYDNNNYITFV